MTRVHARKGSTAVEVGITLPVFVLLLLGIVEWGWAFPRQVTLEHIARDACRTASLRGGRPNSRNSRSPADVLFCPLVLF